MQATISQLFYEYDFMIEVNVSLEKERKPRGEFCSTVVGDDKI